MADRTWNKVESRILDEDWSRVAILVMEQIIIKCPNQYGVYKLPLGFIKRFFDGILAEGQPTVEDAIEELKKDGAIKLYGDVVWMVNKWGREVKNPSWQNKAGAIQHLLDNFEEVLEDFKGAYDIPDTPTMPHQGTIEAPSRVHLCSESDSDSESDPEKEKEIKTKTSKSKPDLPGVCLKLVDELDEIEWKSYVQKAEEEGFPIKQRVLLGKDDREKQADALDKLNRIDKFDWGEIESVLRWAKADTGDGNWPGWSVQFQSCRQLRNKKHGISKYKKMRAAYERRKPDDGKWGDAGG